MTLRVTPPAHPVPARAAKWPKIPPTWHQNGSKMEPKWSQLGTKMEQNGANMGQNFEKKSVQKSNATKKRAEPHSLPPVEPKKWPTWLQVGLQNQSKIDKKSMQKSIVFLMPLGIDFWVDFGGFGEAKSSQVGTKIDQKSLPIAKCDFLKRRLSELTSIFDPILVPTWLDFGTQNPPKSTQKSIPRGIKKMMHFCIDFWAILAPFWDPSWGHVGYFFRLQGGTL